MSLVVSLIQPLVPAYRTPFYTALGQTPGLDLSVWASSASWGSLTSVSGEVEFRRQDAPFRRIGPIVWQGDSVRAVGLRPDVAVLNWNPRSLDVHLALRRCRRLGVASVLWGHGFGKIHLNAGARLLRAMLRKADAAVFYGPTAREHYISLGFDPARLFVAPNAIDQRAISEARSRWLSDPAALDAFRDSEGIHDRPLILFISRLEWTKMPEVAVDALAILSRHHPQAVLAMIGSGSSEALLKERIAERRLQDRVVLLGPIYDEDRIAPWALSATCLVHPGGIGLSLFHAFGYRLPVITTNNPVPHGPEVEGLVEGVNGLRFRHGDADDLARQVRRLIEDRPFRERLADGALATITGPTGRNIPAMVAGFLEAIDFAAERHGKSRV
jgi:glycosyltransferase involved in cell wall biosynthesis